jgi:hypothetical protein
MKRTLKIKNKTRWSGRDLRRLFLAAMAECDVPRLDVEVEYRKETKVHPFAGTHASWTGVRVRLTLPRDPAEMNLARTTTVIEHEIYHVRLHCTIGKHTHLDFPPRLNRWWDATESPAWAKDMPLRFVEPTPKAVVAKRSIAERNEERARRRYAKLQHKQRLLSRLLKLWGGRVRYYDRKRAAAPKEKP